jgi:hypothetical protein
VLRIVAPLYVDYALQELVANSKAIEIENAQADQLRFASTSQTRA